MIPSITTLPNGLTLAALQNPVSPTMVLTGVIPIGAIDETDTVRGVANLTASLLARGTVSHDYDALNEAIEGVGAGVAFWSGIHNTGFSMKSLREDFPDLLQLVGEMLRFPVFPVAHLERIRAQRITGLRERLQNPRAVADTLFNRNLYPAPHPYHYDPIGTIESIATIQRDTIEAFHRATYTPTNGLVVMVGALPPDEAIALASETFGLWDGSMVGDRSVPEVQSQPIEVRETIVGKQQSHLIYGVPTIPRAHPDFMKLQLANIVLGVFGMMGRIGKVVRDEMGLAYTARSGLEGTRGPGAWAATAGVAPDKVEQAVEAIRTEWIRLGREPVSEAELGDCKTLLKGSLPLRLETNDGLARTWLDILYYDLGVVYLENYPALVDSVTAEDILQVTSRYFQPERAVLAVAGP